MFGDNLQKTVLDSWVVLIVREIRDSDNLFALFAFSTAPTNENVSIGRFIGEEKVGNSFTRADSHEVVGEIKISSYGRLQYSGISLIVTDFYYYHSGENIFDIL